MARLGELIPTRSSAVTIIRMASDLERATLQQIATVSLLDSHRRSGISTAVEVGCINANSFSAATHRRRDPKYIALWPV